MFEKFNHREKELLGEPRKIIHIDMDAFFAAVEQRDNPELVGLPVVVGGKPNSRGVVATASYEARQFGIHSAMPCSHASRLCPEAVFLPPRFVVYRRVSRQIMGILREYTDAIEPLSLDEAYLDVTRNKKGKRYARDLASAIKKQIFNYTGLTASAGVAPNKFLAKIASDMNKPDGLTIIPPQKVDDFVRMLPVRKVPGVGKVTEKKMIGYGFRTLGDLQKRSEEELVNIFGKQGGWYYKISRGEDDRPVKSVRPRKSVSCEDTFPEDLTSLDRLNQKLEELCSRLESRLVKANTPGRTVTLKLTYKGFEKITRSQTVDKPVATARELYLLGADLLQKTEAGSRPVRLLGIGVSGLGVDAEAEQLTLGF